MTLHEVFIKNKKIKKGAHPYIIAEIGVNHEGSISSAKKLIEAAARGGAHAAKFQTYKAEKIASVNSPYYWDLKKEKSKNQFELFKKYDSFNAHHYKELHNHCVKNKIDFLSTPFDVECLRFLDPLLNFYKIASADINNIPLLNQNYTIEVWDEDGITSDDNLGSVSFNGYSSSSTLTNGDLVMEYTILEVQPTPFADVVDTIYVYDSPTQPSFSYDEENVILSLDSFDFKKIILIGSELALVGQFFTNSYKSFKICSSISFFFQL